MAGIRLCAHPHSHHTNPWGPLPMRQHPPTRPPVQDSSPLGTFVQVSFYRLGGSGVAPNSNIDLRPIRDSAGSSWHWQLVLKIGVECQNLTAKTRTSPRWHS